MCPKLNTLFEKEIKKYTYFKASLCVQRLQFSQMLFTRIWMFSSGIVAYFLQLWQFRSIELSV